ncbi:hypothetical protein SOPP22_15505 [Shewanella sp. OPT22]|nr:hypothetical protein SOPP22_15505 [Shewanella sp. OPT22]
MSRYSISIFALIFSTSIYAQEPLTIDRQLPTNIQFNFANPNNITPQKSDFEIKSAIPMSSEDGQRWVLLTINNSASGNRTLNQRHLLATLADGSKVKPAAFSQPFKAEETLSISVYFTNSSFPIILVTSNPN